MSGINYFNDVGHNCKKRLPLDSLSKTSAMKITAINGAEETIDAVQPIPCVSVILPFNPAMSLKKELNDVIKIALDYVEAELHEKFPEEISLLLMRKLNSAIKELNFNTNKKSIAIYLSPVFSKVLYLDMPVNATIKVADCFQVREVVSCKKQLEQYLLLQTTTEGFKIFVGSKDKLVKIVSTPYFNRNFTNIDNAGTAVSTIKEAIHHIDQTLEIILQAYKMPLFAAASAYMTEQLKLQSSFAGKFIDYIPLPKIEITPYHLQQLAASHTADWNAVIRKMIHNSILSAAAENKLIAGIRNVCREAMSHQSSLLIIEKDFQCSDAGETSEGVINKAIGPYSNFSYIRNTTDEIIEKVLEDGGDVEFATGNSLEEYDHIVLIKK